MSPFVAAATVMLVSGAAGGAVNFWISDHHDDKQLNCWQHLIVGIVAAFVVPLFLSMASGDLLDKILGVDGKPPDYSRLFVLAGFCLVAATSSRAFIRSVSDRVLQEARAAGQQAKEAKKESAQAVAAVAPLIEDDQTPSHPIETTEPSDAATPTSKFSTLTQEELAILKALATSRFSLRTLSGIAKDSNLPRVTVNTYLNALVTDGLVNQVENYKDGGPRYSISSSGREAVIS